MEGKNPIVETVTIRGKKYISVDDLILAILRTYPGSSETNRLVNALEDIKRKDSD